MPFGKKAKNYPEITPSYWKDKALFIFPGGVGNTENSSVPLSKFRIGIPRSPGCVNARIVEGGDKSPI